MKRTEKEYGWRLFMCWGIIFIVALIELLCFVSVSDGNVGDAIFDAIFVLVVCWYSTKIIYRER